MSNKALNSLVDLSLDFINTISEVNAKDQTSLYKLGKLLESLFKKNEKPFDIGNSIEDPKEFCENLIKIGLLRFNSLKDEIPFLGILSEGQPSSGRYQDLSLVLFPYYGTKEMNQAKFLLCFGIGTDGIENDYELLSSPFSQRILKLLHVYLSKLNVWSPGTSHYVRHQLTDIDSSVPEYAINNLGPFKDYRDLWKKYGKVLISAGCIEANKEGAMAFLLHLLFYAYLRDWPLKKDANKILEYYLMEIINQYKQNPSLDDIKQILLLRKFIILQGPPGVGKTYTAKQLGEKLKKEGFIKDYMIIQFHPSFYYEDFVEGYRPKVEGNTLLFEKFQGPFLKSIKIAKENGGCALIIDEINRGDLSKILGEAIFLLEPNEERKIILKSGIEIEMPKSLYLIGTMNTADRSIALLDIALRRRFAFIDLRPSINQLKELLDQINADEETKKLSLKFFSDLDKIFFKQVPNDEMVLQPGHTYFVARDREELSLKMKHELIPLLLEYIQEGRLQSVSNEILSFIDQILETIEAFK